MQLKLLGKSPGLVLYHSAKLVTGLGVTVLTVLSVIGTRPEGIKMGPVVRELAKHAEHVRSIVCTTGQHREMLSEVLNLFQITPDLDLNVMQPDQTLAQLTARLFLGLDDVVDETRPDWILAQGDTTTVLVSALVGYYRRVQFGHVEAGLRTGDRYCPFPEEVNRYVADHVADYLFAPTEASQEALIREGIPKHNVLMTGNTVIDALQMVATRPYDWAKGPLACLPPDGRYVLVTAHRRESFGEPLRAICAAIKDLAHRFRNDGLQFVYPVHLNPNVRRPVYELLSGQANITLLEPLDYMSFVQLMKRSILILTDSGGIQEEAPGLKIPVLVMRETTERPEGVNTGVVRLVGTSHEHIVEQTSRLLSSPTDLAAMAKGVNPYGDGHAAERIVSAVLGRSFR